MRVSGVLTFTLCIGVGVVTSGQMPQPSTPGQTQQPGQPAPGQPARMPARPLKPGETPPKGTAVVRGYVLAAGTGAPTSPMTATNLRRAGTSQASRSCSRKRRPSCRDW